MSDMTPTAPGAAPRVQIAAQYVKDLSFENPRAAQLLQQQGGGRPELAVQIDVRVEALTEPQYEVVLDLSLKAKTAETELFVIELAYGGLIVAQNLPPEALEGFLYVQVPTLLFPFARRIVADMTRDGGLAPLMLDMIDFAALHRHRVQQAQAGAQPMVANGGATSI